MSKNLVLSNMSLEDITREISLQVAKETAERVMQLVRDDERVFKRRYGQPEESFLEKYIPKTEVRGVLASNSTLWQWEQSGKLELYAIGGKRFYLRKDIENLFELVQPKKKGANK